MRCVCSAAAATVCWLTAGGGQIVAADPLAVGLQELRRTLPGAQSPVSMLEDLQQLLPQYPYAYYHVVSCILPANFLHAPCERGAAALTNALVRPGHDLRVDGGGLGHTE